MLGVDPKLILVIELGTPVDPEEFRRAGLQVLDASDHTAVVAFSDDPALAGFLERLEACASGAPVGGRSEPHAGFVDAIDSVRAREVTDRLGPDLATALIDAKPEAELRIDVELWHPGDRARARAWIDELRDAVGQSGGRVVDAYVNDRAGLVLARVYLPAAVVRAVAELDTIATMDLLPTPALTIPQLWKTSPEDLPPMSSPASNTPIVGLIDSGVASGHPLVGPAVLAAEALSASIPDGEDRYGHGTMVAGLILHGPVDRAIARSSISLEGYRSLRSQASWPRHRPGRVRG